MIWSVILELISESHLKKKKKKINFTSTLYNEQFLMYVDNKYLKVPCLSTLI